MATTHYYFENRLINQDLRVHKKHRSFSDLHPFVESSTLNHPLLHQSICHLIAEYFGFHEVYLKKIIFGEDGYFPCSHEIQSKFKLMHYNIAVESFEYIQKYMFQMAIDSIKNQNRNKNHYHYYPENTTDTDEYEDFLNDSTNNSEIFKILSEQCSLKLLKWSLIYENLTLHKKLRILNLLKFPGFSNGLLWRARFEASLELNNVDLCIQHIKACLEENSNKTRTRELYSLTSFINENYSSLYFDGYQKDSNTSRNEKFCDYETRILRKKEFFHLLYQKLPDLPFTHRIALASILLDDKKMQNLLIENHKKYLKTDETPQWYKLYEFFVTENLPQAENLLYEIQKKALHRGKQRKIIETDQEVILDL